MSKFFFLIYIIDRVHVFFSGGIHYFGISMHMNLLGLTIRNACSFTSHENFSWCYQQWSNAFSALAMTNETDVGCWVTLVIGVTSPLFMYCHNVLFGVLCHCFIRSINCRVIWINECWWWYIIESLSTQSSLSHTLYIKCRLFMPCLWSSRKRLS